MDFSLIYWPRSGRTTLLAKGRTARAWLAAQHGPATALQLARRAMDAGFDVTGGAS